VRQGNQQLAALGRPAPHGRLGLGALVTLVRRRQVGPLDAAAYLGVQVADRVLTRSRRDVHWGTDASTR